MATVNRKILEQIIAATAEPLVVMRVDRPDWPVVLTNPAFESLTEDVALQRPFADVIEKLAGRDLALEVSETVRAQQETSLPVESNGREYLLVLKPLKIPGEETAQYYAAYWRADAGSGSANSLALHHELLKAKRRVRDLSRDDPVTGLLNRQAFADVFAHDWAVAAREKGKLSLAMFRLNEFDEYRDVFGRHSADSCLRRVGQAIRRCLRRASDVAAHLDEESFIVLSHASDEEGVREFAGKISIAVRELGLHHPRSNSSKFVTVSYFVSVADISAETRDAGEFLKDLLAEQVR